MKDLFLKLKEEFNKEEVILNKIIEEDEFEVIEIEEVIINNNIYVFEGSYLKWDILIEDEDIEKSFKSDEELINYLKNII